jgi:hypothetical protein
MAASLRWTRSFSTGDFRKKKASEKLYHRHFTLPRVKRLRPSHAFDQRPEAATHLVSREVMAAAMAG